MAVIQVVGGIIVRKSKVLIAQRKRSGTLGGLFEFPGGKIEPLENPEACLRRELNEELGLLDVSIVSHFLTHTHLYSFGTVELSLYLCRTCTLPTKQNSHDQILWVSPPELGNYPWAPADIPAVEKLTELAVQSS